MTVTNIRVTLENANGTLDLDQISKDGAGVQAVTGATGFGLPDLTYQWNQGAGDGAVARWRRTEPRQMDIPVHIYEADRASLKNSVADVMRVVTYQCTMKVWEEQLNPDGSVASSDYVWCPVDLVGGGTYTYGTDTSGGTEWNSILSFEAGDPYWHHSTELEADIVTNQGTGVHTATVAIDNPGTASAWPIWEIDGPCSDFSVTGPDGSTFDWAGAGLYSGDTLTIDTGAGTVVDQDGVNRYDGLSNAPQFFQVLPDAMAGSTEPSYAISVDGTPPPSRTNYVLNPNFTSTSEWNPSGNFINAQGKSVASQLSVNDGQLVVKGTGNFQVTGLNPGDPLQISFDAYGNGALKGSYAVIKVNGVRLRQSNFGGHLSFNWQTTVPDSGTITITATSGKVKGKPTSLGLVTQELHLGNLFVGTPGKFFSGTTASTSMITYAWKGSANGSISTATYAAASTTSVRCKFTARDWMVV